MQRERLVVLLVEDDPGDALIATEALERAGGGLAAHKVHVSVTAGKPWTSCAGRAITPTPRDRG